MTKEQIFVALQQAMVRKFELSEGAVTRQARLLDDLDLDSIDALDMAVHLQTFTGKRVPLESLKNVKTVGDVVDAVHRLLSTA